jgi:hypothetical protein
MYFQGRRDYTSPIFYRSIKAWAAVWAYEISMPIYVRHDDACFFRVGPTTTYSSILSWDPSEFYLPWYPTPQLIGAHTNFTTTKAFTPIQVGAHTNLCVTNWIGTLERKKKGVTVGFIINTGGPCNEGHHPRSANTTLIK